MCSACNLLAFPNSMFTPFSMQKGYVLSGEIALKIAIIIIIIVSWSTKERAGGVSPEEPKFTWPISVQFAS